MALDLDLFFSTFFIFFIERAPLLFEGRQPLSRFIGTSRERTIEAAEGCDYCCPAHSYISQKSRKLVEANQVAPSGLE